LPEVGTKSNEIVNKEGSLLRKSCDTSVKSVFLQPFLTKIQERKGITKGNK